MDLQTKTKSEPEKKKLLSQIEEKYLREGFYKISMDSLAAEFQISKKTIYKYFPSKESIVEEIVADVTSRVSSTVDGILQMDLNAVEKMVALLQTLIKNLLHFSEKWLSDLRIRMPHLWQKVDEFRTKRMYSALSVIIEQGKKEELIIDRPNEIIITLFISSMRGVVNPDFLYYNKFSYDEAVKITFELLFNGILTQKGKELFRITQKELS
jgi:AcrR family transcriptional regulator